MTDVLPRIQQDARVTGVAIAGSMARGTPDVYSDVDLIVVIKDSAFDSVMVERFGLIDGKYSEIVWQGVGVHERWGLNSRARGA
ncbi:MAG TPA: nucleotidyltransferase domain-containing protein [Streptosporangiaceae bacterium]